MKPALPFKFAANAIGFFLFQVSLFAQANLTVSQADYSPNSISKEDIFSIQVDIKNDGNSSAGQSFIFFYFSTNTDFSDGEIISRVSVKALSAGETTTATIAYPIPRPLNSGTYYLGFKVDAYNYVSESNEDNVFYHPNKFTILNSVTPNNKIPYPIVFVHGLVGDSYTWNPFSDDLDLFYGLTYGGNMNFCLNYDGNTSTSSFTSDYRDFTNLNNLDIGDYYYVNFDVDANGNTYLGDLNNPIESNQSAVFKQGRAVRDAIKNVLQKTGSEKVILVGHSMGGLASREYLQNSIIWQADGKHHVAKLLTIGTPHGGSNATSFGVNGLDELSEAVRDLRTSYYTGYSGCYLFGGTESSSQIFGLALPFVNIDVNCNGGVGQNITGLNQKYYPTDLAYSSIIGYGSLLGGDGVVPENSANINNYIAVNADTFNYKEFIQLGVLHTVLHKRTPLAMKGLDEPNEYAQAYNIEYGKLYFGFSTIQPLDGYEVDYDDYRVSINQTGKLKVSVLDIPVETFRINIVNANEQIISTVPSNGKSNIETEIQLASGTYFVEFESEWTTFSYRFPYAFQVDFNPVVSTDEISNQTFASKIFPNPAKDEAILSFVSQENDKIEIIISDITGRTIDVIQQDIAIGENQLKLDLFNFPSGIYTYSIRNSQNIETKSFIVNK